VILSGNGGDEVGGNSWYLVDRLRRGRLRGTWGELRARAGGKHVGPLRLARNMAGLFARWSRTRLSGRAPAESPAPWLGPVAARHPPQPRALLRDGPLDPVRDSILASIEAIQAEPLMSGFREAFAQLGVEVRSPFLDRRLFEWALGVPGHRFGERGRVKAPFRRALADLLPDAIRDRADKGNYLGYFHLGLREKERPRIERLLERPVSAELGYVDAEALRLAYAAYARGGSIHLAQLWRALTLESWLRERPECLQ
jgi:asparagine synthase (glutamine-hydrolysing)